MILDAVSPNDKDKAAELLTEQPLYTLFPRLVRTKVGIKLPLSVIDCETVCHHRNAFVVVGPEDADEVSSIFRTVAACPRAHAWLRQRDAVAWTSLCSIISSIIVLLAAARLDYRKKDSGAKIFNKLLRPRLRGAHILLY